MAGIKDLVDDSGLLLTSNVIAHGYSRAGLTDFVKRNKFELVSRGIYVSPSDFEDISYIISLRCPQAILSHDVALYHYGLVDREPMVYTFTVYSGYNTSRLKNLNCKAYYVNKDLLELGKIKVKDNFGNEIYMYDMERTIVDMVRNRKDFEIQDYTTALKTYVRTPHKNLPKLLEYAEKFHVEKIIETYMEVLL